MQKMCWKYEWARAINNLNSAIEHIERAQKKLEARLARNEKHLKRLKGSRKYNYPPVLAPVEALIEKNRHGIEECKDIISNFQSRQGQLFCMIHTMGIKHSEAQTVYALMGNYAGKIDCKQFSCEECPLAQN